MFIAGSAKKRKFAPTNTQRKRQDRTERKGPPPQPYSHRKTTPDEKPPSPVETPTDDNPPAPVETPPGGYPGHTSPTATVVKWPLSIITSTRENQGSKHVSSELENPKPSKKMKTLHGSYGDIVARKIQGSKRMSSELANPKPGKKMKTLVGSHVSRVFGRNDIELHVDKQVRRSGRARRAPNRLQY